MTGARRLHVSKSSGRQDQCLHAFRQDPLAEDLSRNSIVRLTRPVSMNTNEWGLTLNQSNEALKLPSFILLADADPSDTALLALLSIDASVVLMRIKLSTFWDHLHHCTQYIEFGEIRKLARVTTIPVAFFEVLTALHQIAAEGRPTSSNLAHVKSSILSTIQSRARGRVTALAEMREGMWLKETIADMREKRSRNKGGSTTVRQWKGCWRTRAVIMPCWVVDSSKMRKKRCKILASVVQRYFTLNPTSALHLQQPPVTDRWMAPSARLTIQSSCTDTSLLPAYLSTHPASLAACRSARRRRHSRRSSIQQCG